jgi:RNA polymerase primary sigma factor
MADEDPASQKSAEKSVVRITAGILRYFTRAYRRGPRKGLLTYREIEDAFERVDITPEQIEKVYEALEKMGIEIVADNIEEEFEDLQFLDVEEEDIDISIPEASASMIR